MIPPIERNSSHPRIFFADFIFVASAKLAHQKMQSVDNIFEQALPTVIGFPSMPLSSMATVAIFLAVTLPLNAVNDKFSKLDNCIDKSLADITGLDSEVTRSRYRSRAFTAGMTREYSCCVKYRQ